MKISIDLLREGEFVAKTLLESMDSGKPDAFSNPMFDTSAMANAQVMEKGMPETPGAATGKPVCSAAGAE